VAITVVLSRSNVLDHNAVHPISNILEAIDDAFEMTENLAADDISHGVACSVLPE
jgi:hypothetical protein